MSYGQLAFYTLAGTTRIAQIAYLPFGNVRTLGGAAPTQVFAGHEWDREAGLYYMDRRY